MNPDVASAVRALEARSVLTPAEADHLLRVAEGKLVSVRHELRLLLYAGVVLITAGVSVLVGENLERIGPIAIALGLSAFAALCLLWVLRHLVPFSWGEAAPAHPAFDYILLLGVLLLSADVAYIEAQFTPLGANWPWHLLGMSLVMGALSLRADSRVVFSLSLSTFAAWRGVSLSFLEGGFWSNFETATRLNTALVGLLFVGVGFGLLHYRRKPHFEPVATYLGWTLFLVAVASGALSEAPSYGAYNVVLLFLGAGLGLRSLRGGRFPLFAMGAASAYVALSRWAVPILDDETLVFSWFLVTSIASIAALVRTHRTLEQGSWKKDRS
jgi:hypothetical protein